MLFKSLFSLINKNNVFDLMKNINFNRMRSLRKSMPINNIKINSEGKEDFYPKLINQSETRNFFCKILQQIVGIMGGFDETYVELGIDKKIINIIKGLISCFQDPNINKIFNLLNIILSLKSLNLSSENKIVLKQLILVIYGNSFAQISLCSTDNDKHIIQMINELIKEATDKTPQN